MSMYECFGVELLCLYVVDLNVVKCDVGVWFSYWGCAWFVYKSKLLEELGGINVFLDFTFVLFCFIWGFSLRTCILTLYLSMDQRTQWPWVMSSLTKSSFIILEKKGKLALTGLWFASMFFINNHIFNPLQNLIYYIALVIYSFDLKVPFGYILGNSSKTRTQ